MNNNNNMNNNKNMNNNNLNNNNNNNYDNLNDDDFSGKITYLGKIYAELPIDIQYSRFIIICSFFNLIDIGIIVSAICNQEKRMFFTMKKYDLYQIKKELPYEQNQNCDFIVNYNIFWEWKKNYGYKMQSKKDEFEINEKFLSKEDKQRLKNFIDKFGLNLFCLIDIFKSEIDLKKKLTKFNKYNFDNDKQINFLDRKNCFYFKFALMGSFYKNLIYAEFDDLKINLKNNYINNTINNNFDEEYDKNKRTIEIRNIDKINIIELEKYINSIIIPDKIIEIKNNFNNTINFTFGLIDSIKKLYFICNDRNEIQIIQLEKQYKIQLSKYEYKINFKALNDSQNLIIDNESINSIIVENPNKKIEKERLVTDKFEIRGDYKFCKYLSLIPSIPFFDELSIIIFSPDLIFESDKNNRLYKSFRFNEDDTKIIDLSCYFGTIDLNKINNLRKLFNQLLEKPYYNQEKINNELKIIENKEISLLREKIYKEIDNLLKGRIEIIKNKDIYENLFNKYFGNFIIDDNFPNRNKYIEENNNIIYNPTEFLKPLKRINNLNEDFRIATEMGKKNILEQKKKYKELSKLLKEEYELAERINSDDYSINLFCKKCNDYICSIFDILKNNNNLNNGNGKIYFNIWECGLNEIEIGEMICDESDFVKKCREKNYLVDCYISCRNNHIFAGKYSDKLFITSFSKLYIKYYDNSKEDFCQKLIDNNFEILKNKIDIIKEEINKKRNQFYSCDLCGPFADFVNVKEFVKHLKDPNHILHFNNLIKDTQY